MRREKKKKKKRNSTVSKVVRISRIRFVSVFWIPSEQVRAGKFCLTFVLLGLEWGHTRRKEGWWLPWAVADKNTVVREREREMRLGLKRA